MRRIAVKYSGDTMIVSPDPLAHATDAAINSAIAFLLMYPIVRAYSLGDRGMTFAGILTFTAPVLIFGVMALKSAIVAVARPEIVIDRKQSRWKINAALSAETDAIRQLGIKYTGLTGPSRYSLVAELDNGKVQRLASTGYTGSRDELVALSQLIADFTNRPNLYAR